MGEGIFARLRAAQGAPLHGRSYKPAEQANEPLHEASARESTSREFARGMTAAGWRATC